MIYACIVRDLDGYNYELLLGQIQVWKQYANGNTSYYTKNEASENVHFISEGMRKSHSTVSVLSEDFITILCVIRREI